MTNVAIRKEHASHGDRYVATVAGIDGEAELVVTERGPNLGHFPQ